MLAQTSPVAYRIQHYAEAVPEIVHVDKLMAYQAVLGEELQSWLQDEKSGGHRVKETQTSLQVPSETLPELADCISSKLEGIAMIQVLRAVSALIWRTKNPL